MAEFAPMDMELAAMSDAVSRSEAGLINEDELDRLATEIPDMRTRLGIRCAHVARQPAGVGAQDGGMSSAGCGRASLFERRSTPEATSDSVLACLRRQVAAHQPCSRRALAIHGHSAFCCSAESDSGEMGTQVPDGPPFNCVCLHRDDQVFAGSKLSLMKVQLQFQEGVSKVRSLGSTAQALKVLLSRLRPVPIREIPDWGGRTAPAGMRCTGCADKWKMPKRLMWARATFGACSVMWPALHAEAAATA